MEGSPENRPNGRSPDVQGERLREFALGNLTAEESLRVLSEIEQSPEASEEVDFYIDFVRFARDEGSGIFAGEAGDRVRRGPWHIGGEAARRLREPRVVYGAIAVAAVLLAMLVSASWILTDPVHGLARLDGVAYVSSVRGPAAEQVEFAQLLYEAGEGERALEELERVLRAYPDTVAGAYVRYMAGVVCLAGAERSVLGLFPHFETGMVERGLGHLKVVDQATTNARLTEEVSWVTAKAFLMLGRRGEAEAILRELAGRGGSRARAADSLSALLVRGG